MDGPMYFLLANLSFVDFCLSSVTTPKLITDFLKDNKTISFGGCMSQILFIHFLAGDEMVLLVTMAYDRCVAICKPLHYSSIMNRQQCILLVLTSWIIGFVHAASQLAMILDLPFCGPNIIDHFLCDMDSLMALSCAPAPITEFIFYTQSSLVLFFTIMYILRSYTLQIGRAHV